jgi:large subunit ribosomal protein L10
MVTKNDKERIVDELKDKFSRAKSVFSTKQLGLTVAEITNLRNSIRDLNAEFKIAKNTLFKKAAEGTEFAPATEELKGTTAFLFCYEDPIAPAGQVKKFSKENAEKVSFENGVLEGEFLDTEKAIKVASLPSKDTLLSQIAGMLVQNTVSIAYIMGQLGEKEEKEKALREFIVAETSNVETASSVDEAKAKEETSAAEAKVEEKAQEEGKPEA